MSGDGTQNFIYNSFSYFKTSRKFRIFPKLANFKWHTTDNSVHSIQILKFLGWRLGVGPNLNQGFQESVCNIKIATIDKGQCENQ